MKNLFTKLKLI